VLIKKLTLRTDLFFVRHKEGRRLRLQVLDEDRLSKDDLIGEDNSS
jgi:predicted ThiF/HesA family dinucleotide-utilizing enzyme